MFYIYGLLGLGLATDLSTPNMSKRNTYDEAGPNASMSKRNTYEAWPNASNVEVVGALFPDVGIWSRRQQRRCKPTL